MSALQHHKSLQEGGQALKDLYDNTKGPPSVAMQEWAGCQYFGFLNQSFQKSQTLTAAVCSTSPQCAGANVIHDKSRPMKNRSSRWLPQQASQFKTLATLRPHMYIC